MSSTHQMASSDDPAGVKPVEYDDTNVQNIMYMFEYSIYYLIIGLKCLKRILFGELVVLKRTD